MQGTMQGKLFQRFTHFLCCSVLSLGGKANTRQMSQLDMEFIFTKIIYEIFWSKETFKWIFKIIKIKFCYPRRILNELNEHWCIYSCLQSPPKEYWFQYVRRVYATAINIRCISTLVCSKYNYVLFSCIPRFCIKIYGEVSFDSEDTFISKD